MISPLAQRLAQVKWGKFTINDCAEVLPSSAKLTKENLTDSGSVDVYSSDSTNNGVVGQTNLEPNYLVTKETPFYLIFGDHTRAMNIAHRNFSVMDNVKVLIPKYQEKNVILFISTAWKKAIPNLGYARHWSKAKDCEFYLPTTQNNEIDFEFINSFVEELEAERVEELEAYLTASGLKDYTLTEEEYQAVKNLDSLKYESFNLEKLFGKSTRGKRLKSADRKEGHLPFITAGETNEGISAFIGNDVDIFSRNTITIDMFGSAKYRNYEYGADDHIAVVHSDHLTENASIFVTTSIHKSSHNGQFNYGRNFYAKDADNLSILLPVNDDSPDYKTMALLISAIKKLVIKDVVKYADSKISATKTVLGH